MKGYNMKEDTEKNFLVWAETQVNRKGQLFKKHTISNYNSALNTIIHKLNINIDDNITCIYDYNNADKFESIYKLIINNSNFYKINSDSNATFSSALLLYRRYLRFITDEKAPPILETKVSEEKEKNRQSAHILSDEELLHRINNKPKSLTKHCTIISKNYYRDQEIAEYAVRRAQGKCDLCNCNAPFLKEDGTPYLEAHHVQWLSKGGEDSINNIVALCPNCHKRIHVLNKEEDHKKLVQRLIQYNKNNA